jgi:PKD repeat protein
MRKFFFTVLLLFGSIMLIANKGYQVNYTQVTSTTSQVAFTLGDFSYRPVNLNGTDFTKIHFAGSVTTVENGFAEVPFINANIQLNPVKNVRLNVVEMEYQDYQLDHPLVPSRGVIYRNQDPGEIPYVIAPESVVDEFYPSPVATLTDPYIIKDVRGATVYVYPFQYNAVKQVLRVYTSVTVELVEDDSEPVNPLYETSGKFFRDMEDLYHTVFVNYESNMEDLTMGEAGDILVITTARDEAAIQPYIDWKMEKGHNVFKEVVPTGTNVATLVQQKYDENNSILFVQLVGDWADIKSNTGGGANAPMDPVLGCVVGTDNFPDIAIGRFSANSAAHVTIQVDKTIQYEKNPSGTWYSKAISIASNEGAGIGDDGEIDYQHTDIIYNNKLNPFTYDNHSTAYAPGATSVMVKNYIETGASIINYTGHGSQTSWSTSGFSNNNVNQLTNGDMLPFIFSVACVNGAFHNSSDCFAEAWLKKEDGGAVIALMATINQPWTPPMRGQDYFNDLITGGYDYSSNPGNGINTDEGRSVIGSIVVNGLVLMYTEANATQDLNTIQTWTTFGDASIQVRTEEPQPLSLSSDVMLVGTPFETTITSNGSPVENALVSLSQEGVYASAYTDETGMVSIPNEFLPGDVLLVVTAYNTETVYESIQCIPPTGPYVIFDAVEINDTAGNNNGQLDYGETTDLNLSVKNVGVFEATDLQVTITSEDEYVTIVNGTASFGNVPAGGNMMVENAFTIEAANDIPDGHNIQFSMEAEAPGEEAWESSFSVVAHSAVLEYDDYYIVDMDGNNNNKLDPGETVDMFVVVKNTGNSDAYEVTGTLSTADPYITISQPMMAYGDISAGEEMEMSFEVSADEMTPAGHMAEFTFDMAADMELSAQADFTLIVGQIPVLIVDLDENNNSANKMVEALNEINVSHELVTSFPTNLTLYSSVFVCLGIYSDNHTLTTTQGQALADYLNNGGNLYMEGGDTWYYDEPTPVHGMFNIEAIGDGSSDLSTVLGQTGTFTDGMSFPYNGDNNWIDRIGPSGDAVLILQNSSPVYGTGVANDAGTYKTIGASHEFGGLNGDRNALMEAYLNFFDMLPSTLVPNFVADVTEGCEGMEVEFTDQSVGATEWLWAFPGGTPEASTEQNPVVVYETGGTYHVTLEVSDGTNSTSMTKSNYIHVMHEPDQAGEISGDDQVVMGDIADYQVEELETASLYVWELTPAEAGEMTMDMNTVTIHWSEDWYGIAALKVCGGNDCGMGEYSEEFEVEVADPTGITIIDETTFSIYPNPSKGQFVIELSAKESVSYNMGVVNILGVEVLRKDIEVNGSYNETIDLSAVPEGVYYLYLKNDEQSVVRKLIIQR